MYSTVKKTLLLYVLIPFQLLALEPVWNGAHYSEYSDLQWKAAMHALNYYDIPPQVDLLDVGCGNGRITQYIAQRYETNSTLGIDRSASMVTQAEREHSQHNLLFKELSATDITSQSSFDRIVSFNCLHWVADIQKALSNIYHALKDDGICLLLVSSRPTIY